MRPAMPQAFIARAKNSKASETEPQVKLDRAFITPLSHCNLLNDLRRRYFKSIRVIALQSYGSLGTVGYDHTKLRGALRSG